MPFDEAINNITTQPQYFEIAHYDDKTVHLVDENYNHKLTVAASDADPSEYTEYTGKAYGKDIPVRIMNESDASSEGDFIYTNVMEIRGVQAKGADGKLLYDENNNPVISSVEINEVNGVPLATYAFSLKLGTVAGKILAVAVLLFAFSTVLGWSFYGTKALEFLFGTKATNVYKIIFIHYFNIPCFTTHQACINNDYMRRLFFSNFTSKVFCNCFSINTYYIIFFIKIINNERSNTIITFKFITNA